MPWQQSSNGVESSKRNLPEGRQREHERVAKKREEIDGKEVRLDTERDRDSIFYITEKVRSEGGYS